MDSLPRSLSTKFLERAATVVVVVVVVVVEAMEGEVGVGCSW